MCAYIWLISMGFHVGIYLWYHATMDASWVFLLRSIHSMSWRRPFQKGDPLGTWKIYVFCFLSAILPLEQAAKSSAMDDSKGLDLL